MNLTLLGSHTHTSPYLCLERRVGSLRRICSSVWALDGIIKNVQALTPRTNGSYISAQSVLRRWLADHWFQYSRHDSSIFFALKRLTPIIYSNVSPRTDSIDIANLKLKLPSQESAPTLGLFSGALCVEAPIDYLVIAYPTPAHFLCGGFTLPQGVPFIGGICPQYTVLCLRFHRAHILGLFGIYICTTYLVLLRTYIYSTRDKSINHEQLVKLGLQIRRNP